ncbi:MAG: DNA-deoxyinosine glycosylase [Propionivibrio sp.]
MAADLLIGLPPILDAGVETLILGSFPSPASLAAAQYYAHRQNQFWRLMAVLLREPLLELAYPEKQQRLLQHRIGVWDVYRSCVRQGALDSAIRLAEANDFSSLESKVPHLRRIFFNGKTSGRFEAGFRERGYDTRVLPSTSPAYTLAFDEKVERWRAAGIGSAVGR